MNRKVPLAAAAVLVLVAGVLAGMWYTRAAFDAAVPQLGIELAHPDVLVQSRALAALPRELVALPGLRDVLTQEFVNYYEEHPERLSVEGALRRLAFERGLTWQDRLGAAILDSPGSLALWRDGKGRLAYAALLLEKNTAAAALEQLAKVALPDSQLTRAGSMRVGVSDTTVYALKLRTGSSLLLLSSGKHILVFTHPGMLLNENGQLAGRAGEAAQAVLESRGASWNEDFALGPLPAATRHAIAAKAAWLSFGYQYFFPQVHAVKLEFSGARWTLDVAAAPAVWQDWAGSAKAAWNAMPRGAAFCVALPVTWDRAAAPLGAAFGADAAPLAADLLPGAGTCWYAANGLYAPVVAFRFKPGTGLLHDADLRTLLENSVKTAKGKQPAVAQRDVPGGRFWSSDVPSPYGYIGTGNSRAHRMAALRQGDTVLASVDHRALDQALAVRAKTYPALADEFNGSPVLLSVLPELGRMLQAESQRLTQATPAFQQLVRTQLKPRLDAMGAGGKVAFAAPTAPVAPPAADARATWVWKPLTQVAGASR